MFYLQAALLGLGLSMDAVAVSMADGLREPAMGRGKVLLVAGAFGLFQGVMPLIGYGVGSLFGRWLGTIAPYLAFVILGFLGIKMIVEGARRGPVRDARPLAPALLLAQALATSIDALTVGIVYVAEPLGRAVAAFAIIAAVTLLLSAPAVALGKKIGTKFCGKAEIAGGVILIAIGLKVLLEHLSALW